MRPREQTLVQCDLEEDSGRRFKNSTRFFPARTLHLCEEGRFLWWLNWRAVRQLAKAIILLLKGRLLLSDRMADWLIARGGLAND